MYRSLKKRVCAQCCPSLVSCWFCYRARLVGLINLKRFARRASCVQGSAVSGDDKTEDNQQRRQGGKCLVWWFILIVSFWWVFWWVLTHFWCCCGILYSAACTFSHSTAILVLKQCRKWIPDIITFPYVSYMFSGIFCLQYYHKRHLSMIFFNNMHTVDFLQLPF